MSLLNWIILRSAIPIMRTAPLTFVAASSLATIVHADFAIWYSVLATAGDPGGPIWSANFVPYLDSGVACADVDSGVGTSSIRHRAFQQTSNNELTVPQYATPISQT